METERRSNSGTRLLILVLILIALLALIFGIWAMWFRPAPTLNPDYAAKDTEANAEQIEDDGQSKLDSPSGGGAVTLIYAREVDVSLTDGTVRFLIGNPAESTEYLIAQIVIQDHVIAQSGAIRPGYRVTELPLEASAAPLLQSGGYDGKIVLYMYDEETDERAMVNSEIIVTVSVHE